MVAQPPTHISWIELVRAYAIILVVIVHTSAPPLYAYNSVPRSYWLTADLFDSFARPCVPLFIMVSGYLLLDPRKDEPLGTFFRKRFTKVCVPYVFWAFFYIWWRWSFHGEHFTPATVGRELIGGRAYYHLFFMNVIIGLYLLTPLLRAYVKNADLPTQLYVLGLWFVLSSLTPVFTKLTALPVNVYLQTTPRFLGHFLFGALLHRVQFRPRGWRLAALSGALVATGILTAVLTYHYTSKAGGNLDESFYNYASPTVVVMSAISFLLLMALFSQPIFQHPFIATRLLHHIGATSFGIYLTHIIVLESLGRGIFFGYPLTTTAFHPALSIPVITAIVVLTCAGVLRVVQTIPGARYIVP